MIDATPERERPLVTFALFAYNQEKYIREAVEGALSQAYSPLEIILSDDCSSDRTFEIMQEVSKNYKGPHQVRVRKNRYNLGITSHVNSVIVEARGEFIVVSAGDDISLPERTARSVLPMIDRPDLCFVEVNYREFKGDNRIHSMPPKPDKMGTIELLDKINGTAPPTKGAVRAIRTKSALYFPPLRSSCPTEDTPMAMRLLYLGAGLRIDYVGCLLRKHERNLSLRTNFKKDHWENLILQFREDINYALDKRLIDSKSAKKVHDHFDYRMNLSKLSGALDDKDLSPGAKLKYVWQSSINRREKLRLFSAAAKKKVRAAMRVMRS